MFADYLFLMTMLECSHKWYDPVCRILWDFFIQTDKAIEHRLPDIVCIDKIVNSYLIIDIAITGDQNIIGD